MAMDRAILFVSFAIFYILFYYIFCMTPYSTSIPRRLQMHLMKKSQKTIAEQEQSNSQVGDKTHGKSK
jgi:hypothetical protein